MTPRNIASLPLQWLGSNSCSRNITLRTTGLKVAVVACIPLTSTSLGGLGRGRLFSMLFCRGRSLRAGPPTTSNEGPATVICVARGTDGEAAGIARGTDGGPGGPAGIARGGPARVASGTDGEGRPPLALALA